MSLDSRNWLYDLGNNKRVGIVDVDTERWIERLLDRFPRRGRRPRRVITRGDLYDRENPYL